MEIILSEEEKKEIAKKIAEEKEKENEEKKESFSKVDKDIEKSKTNLVNFAGNEV